MRTHASAMMVLLVLGLALVPEMKPTFTFVLLCVLYSLRQLATAVCIGTSVRAFGAEGDVRRRYDGHSSAITRRLRPAWIGGVRRGTLLHTGSFVVPKGVVLCGAIEGRSTSLHKWIRL